MYPILNIKQLEIGPRCYVDKLEQIVIELLQNRFKIAANRTKDTGIWIQNKKIAAIGIQIQRHVTSHGLSLNCNTDLEWFDKIVPCGLTGMGVTSISSQLRRDISVEQVLPMMMNSIESVFQTKMESIPDDINLMIDDFIRVQ